MFLNLFCSSFYSAAQVLECFIEMIHPEQILSFGRLVLHIESVLQVWYFSCQLCCFSFQFFTLSFIPVVELLQVPQLFLHGGNPKLQVLVVLRSCFLVEELHVFYLLVYLRLHLLQ